MSIEVSQTLSDNAMDFESISDFNKYYQKHQELVDSMTTRGLNIKYRISGYKLGRKKTKLQFIANDKNIGESCEIEELERKIDELREMMVALIKAFKSVNQ